MRRSSSLYTSYEYENDHSYDFDYDSEEDDEHQNLYSLSERAETMERAAALQKNRLVATAAFVVVFLGCLVLPLTLSSRGHQYRHDMNTSDSDMNNDSYQPTTTTTDTVENTSNTTSYPISSITSSPVVAPTAWSIPEPAPWPSSTTTTTTTTTTNQPDAANPIYYNPTIHPSPYLPPPSPHPTATTIMTSTTTSPTRTTPTNTLSSTADSSSIQNAASSNLRRATWKQLGRDLPIAQNDYDNHHYETATVHLAADGHRLAVGDADGVAVYEMTATDRHWRPVGMDIVVAMDTDHDDDNKNYNDDKIDHHIHSKTARRHLVALSADGHRLAVGAQPLTSSSSLQQITRVYAWTGTSWDPLGLDVDNQGTSLSLSDDGERVAIGGLQDGIDIGSSNNRFVRVYEWSGFSWHPRGDDEDLRGDHATLSGNGMCVGVDTGRVYEWTGGSLADDVWHVLGGDHHHHHDEAAAAANHDSDNTATAAAERRTAHWVSLSSDGRVLALGWTDRVRVWRYVAAGFRWEAVGPDIEVAAMNTNDGVLLLLQDMVVSADGRKVAVRYGDDNDTNAFVRVVEWSDEHSAWLAVGPDIPAAAAATLSLSASGDRVATAVQDNNRASVRVYELVTNE